MTNTGLYYSLKSRFLKQTTSIVYPILGMHRSGTSLLSRIITEKNISVGLDVNTRYSYSNPEGHFEDRRAVSINREFLRQNGGSWRNIPSSLKTKGWFGTLREVTNKLRLLHYVRKRCDQKSWAFKDPRTCLTYPHWKQALESQNVMIVAIYRHYEEVIGSLVERDGMLPEKALDMWINYNQLLLYHLRRSEDYLLLQYKDLLDSTPDCGEVINRRIGGKDVDLNDLVDGRDKEHDEIMESDEADRLLEKLASKKMT